MKSKWFVEARYGLFVHFGLFSLLGRGEWVWNRERIARDEYNRLADDFDPRHFDAEAICDLAVEAGMRYAVLTTMHHDGFRLYDTQLSDFKSRRDLVAEFVEAARARGLRVGLYHSLNNWHDLPDAVDALEDPAARRRFLEATFSRIRELVTMFNPIDTLWYDGWWPFNAEGWRAEEMNAMVREIQPHILFNGRNGLPGDFATPEGHLGAPSPWRPWEACMTLNSSWGYHQGDHDWRSPGQVIDLLAACAQGTGNLLLNIGPAGDGSVPPESLRILREVGGWLRRNGEAIYGTEKFTFDLREKGAHLGDWSTHGPYTMKGRAVYWLIRKWPGQRTAISGFEGRVVDVRMLESGKPVAFRQEDDVIRFDDLPGQSPDPWCSVLRLEFDSPPRCYMTAGMRIPKVEHPHYDPCPSDILA